MMLIRRDLLELTPHDLGVYASPGLVRRAEKEINEGAAPLKIECRGDATLVVEWQDGIQCSFPSSSSRKPYCSCQSLSFCRHLVRSVLAYQRSCSEQSSAEDGPQPVEWDPADIPLEALGRLFSKRALTLAAQSVEEGMIAELDSGLRPWIRSIAPPFSMIFPVAFEPTYCHCSCGEAPPCRHVPVAYFAFKKRRESGRSERLIDTTKRSRSHIPALRERAEKAVRMMACYGFGHKGCGWREALVQMRTLCAEGSLIWPEEVIAELLEQASFFDTRDSRYSPSRVSALVGELLIRLDVMQHASVPLHYVAGSHVEEGSRAKSIELTGLGTEVKREGDYFRFRSFAQVTATGEVVMIEGKADAGETFKKVAENSTLWFLDL